MNIIDKWSQFINTVFKTTVDIFFQALRMSPNAQGYIGGSITEILVMKELKKNYIIGFAVLRNVQDIDKYFLLAFFKTDIFIKQVKRMMTGHAIPCISPTNLGQIIVPVPNKHTQNEIAKRIKKIIALNQMQQKEINKLQKGLECI